MKKISIPIFVFGSLLFTFCEKDRTCVCTEKSTYNGTTSPATTKTIQYKKIKKKDAEYFCQTEAYRSGLSIGGSAVTGTVYTASATSDCKLN